MKNFSPSGNSIDIALNHAVLKALPLCQSVASAASRSNERWRGPNFRSSGLLLCLCTGMLKILRLRKVIVCFFYWIWLNQRYYLAKRRQLKRFCIRSSQFLCGQSARLGVVNKLTISVVKICEMSSGQHCWSSYLWWCGCSLRYWLTHERVNLSGRLSTKVSLKLGMMKMTTSDQVALLVGVVSKQ